MIKIPMQYRIKCRIPGKTPWENEGSGNNAYDTREAAQEFIDKLEDTNDDGEPLEYKRPRTGGCRRTS